MSGITGILNLDGAPVEKRLLRRMTDSLRDRGPDAREVWLDGAVGFGHALLRTTAESADERQPCNLDRRVWITADARLDGQADLSRKLGSRRSSALQSANDAQLILHAYHAWGEACVEHLLGDFAFAIWDGRARRLFCARDHFGVKPFYYAHVGRTFVFSNTLDCIRLHPAVSDELNELAIGDFLLFGSNQEPATTCFADVARLAPAHCLICAEGSARARRYWTLPAEGRIRYRRSQDYVDHFKEVLRAAVGDRLRTNRAGVWMSGGLDSTSIAAVAREILSGRGVPFDLHAHAIVYDTLIPDNERHYAGVAAKALGIEISYFAADECKPFEGWDQAESWTPEPCEDPFLFMRARQLRQAARHSRVVLCGEGGDEVLWGSHLVDLLGTMPLRELGADVARTLVVHRRRPGVGIRARLKQWLRYRSERPPFPAWLNGDFADRAGLRARWEQLYAPPSTADHALRPEAYWRLATGPWASYCESCDPGVTRNPVECRYPFLDVRLVCDLLAIPPFPWYVDKHLLRVAIRGALPDPVRLRPKAPLAGDPLGVWLRKAGIHWKDRFDPTPDLAPYVDSTTIPKLAGERDGHEPWLNVRPLCLNEWLRRVHSVTRIEEEIPDEDHNDEREGRWSGQEVVREA